MPDIQRELLKKFIRDLEVLERYQRAGILNKWIISTLLRKYKLSLVFYKIMHRNKK